MSCPWCLSRHRRIHCGVEVTESSTNKQQTLSPFLAIDEHLLGLTAVSVNDGGNPSVIPRKTFLLNKFNKCGVKVLVGQDHHNWASQQKQNRSPFKKSWLIICSTQTGEISNATCIDSVPHTFSGAGRVVQLNCTCNKDYTGPDGVTYTACNAEGFKGTNCLFVHTGVPCKQP